MANKKKTRRRTTVVIVIAAVVLIGALLVVVGPKPTRSSGLLTSAVASRDVARTAEGTGTVVDSTTVAVLTSGDWTTTERDGVTLSSAAQSSPVTVSSVAVHVGSTVTKGQALAKVKGADGSTKTIDAPAAGVVRTLTAVAGSQASGTVVTLGVGGMHVSVPISEYDVSNLTDGLSVSLDFEGLGLTRTGTVLAVSPVASDSAAGSGSTSSGSSDSSVTDYPVVTSIQSVPDTARVGMNVQTTVKIKQVADALAVPVQALDQDGSGHYSVMVATTTNNRTTQHRTAVTVGLVGDSYAQVTSGLRAGQQVVTGKASTSTATTSGPGF